MLLKWLTQENWYRRSTSLWLDCWHFLCAEFRLKASLICWALPFLGPLAALFSYSMRPSPSFSFVRLPCNGTSVSPFLFEKDEVCIGKIPRQEESAVFFGKSFAFRIGKVSTARVVCWTMSACPGKIRRHMAALIALGRVCVGAPSLLQKEVVCQLGAWEKWTWQVADSFKLITAGELWSVSKWGVSHISLSGSSYSGWT